MSSTSTHILNIYLEYPAYFQRLLDYFLHSRFRVLRLFIKGLKETVFITVDGRISDTHNHAKKYETLTDWYNSMKGTNFPTWYTELFGEIHISNRVTVLDVIEGVSQKEYDEFTDSRYKSSLANAYISRRLLNLHLPFNRDRNASFKVEWQGATYDVGRFSTRSESGINVIPFLNALSNQEEECQGLYCWMEGKRLLITTEAKEDTDERCCPNCLKLQEELRMLRGY